MKRTKISAIAAIAGKKRVIGKNGKLPWYIPGELKRFKKITMGHPIIMGRKTYDSIGRVLEGRINIIITHDPNFKVEVAIVVHSLKEALKVAKDNATEELFIIGGQQIFEQAFPKIDKLYLTVIDKEIDGDVFFPLFEEFENVKEVGRGEHQEIRYTFLELERKTLG